MSNGPRNILIEFVKVWGNPAGPQIFGPGQQVRVSQWAADRLVPEYAKLVEKVDDDSLHCGG